MSAKTLIEILGPVAAVATAFFTWRAVVQARRAAEATRDGALAAQEAVSEARKARKLEIVMSLSQRFGGQDMYEAMKYLGGRRHQYSSLEAMIEAYVSETSSTPPNSVGAWEHARRRVSKFFIEVRNLCVTDMVNEALLASTLQKAAFDLFLDIAAPLDRAHNNRVLGRNDFDDSAERYFSDFRRRQLQVLD